MTISTDGNGRRIKPNCTMRLVRENYREKSVVTLTYAEVADMAGVTVGTVAKWISKGLLPVVRKVGPYRIDKMAAQEFLRTGVKQYGWSGKKK